MEPITLSELAASIGGGVEHLADVSVGPDACIDSRKVTEGALFVALPGERVDGHAYVGAALAAGAAAALVDHVPEGVDPGRCIVVDRGADGHGVRAAFGRVARHVVDGFDGLQVIGITGSQGKTSTKDLLASILTDAAPTIAPVGSQNNEIGVPLTACSCSTDTRFLVAEMGARGIGHIAYLCDITPPSVAMVLNVGVAHVGEFGSRDAIARAKGELVEALDAQGWAVLNGMDPYTREMASRTRGKIAWFSGAGRPEVSADLIVWADGIASGELDRHRFTLVVERGENVEHHPVELQVSGRHQVANATAAAAAAVALGVSPAAVAASLTAATSRSRWRMEVTRRRDGLVVCNDAYNANPDSMMAACRSLAAIGRAERRDHPGSRTVAVLGDMLELGDASAAEHQAIGRAVAALGIDVLIAVGEFGEDLVAGARGSDGPEVEAHRVDDAAEASELAKRVTTGQDVVLVKASRSIALETVADALLADEQLDDRPRSDT